MNKLIIAIGRFLFGNREDAAEFYGMVKDRTIKPMESGSELLARIERNVERDLLTDRVWVSAMVIAAAAVLSVTLASGAINGAVGWSAKKINAFQQERVQGLVKESDARIDAAAKMAAEAVEKERNK
jgi:hypothetical protein